MSKQTIKITESGDKFYYMGDKLHRDGGPAAIYGYGKKVWYSNGLIHNLNGPAIAHPDGENQYRIFGHAYSKADYDIIINAFLCTEGYEYVRIELSDRVERRLYGRLHSKDDIPAIEFHNGTREWYQNGLCHRVGKPAILTHNGLELWYQDGLMHNDDGPALLSDETIPEWWIRGKQYSKIEFDKRNKRDT